MSYVCEEHLGRDRILQGNTLTMANILFCLPVLLLILEPAALDSSRKRSESSGPSSTQLLRYEEGHVIVNKSVLDKLAQLTGPIHVLTAIGDARIGKSTALNLMAAMMESKDKKGRVQSVPPVFSVCGSLDTCTKGVWVYVLPLQTRGHLIILDVEGTDLGGDLITTQFSLLTAYVATDIVVFLKEAVPPRAAIFLHELARLKERQHQANAGHVGFTQKLYVVIRDPLKPPEDVSLAEYVSQSLTSPTYCFNDKAECMLLEKHFLYSQKINVYSMPYVNRRHQKSLEWTSKDKSYLRTIETLTLDLKNAASVRSTTPDSMVSGSLLSGIIQTFLATFGSLEISGKLGSTHICPGNQCPAQGGHIEKITPEELPVSDTTVGSNSPENIPDNNQDGETGSDQNKLGTIDIESIIKTPFETMGPGVYSYVMSNMKRLGPTGKSTSAGSGEGSCSNAERDTSNSDCDSTRKDTMTKWSKAVRGFIDDMADALDDFFESVMDD